ncbi:hypothetical protein HER32_02730 [Hymenobacter sp. BT18]|uniref:hypothetical protein n=1 Tax=Hymenobacter sp. BT18 TaxID=2835648 RepID=UPI00143E5383|nr:hypothetical protein [Hymenobacter sp. BT18]QIX60158.1 hypothetical protein HER32_02730 [Hymenobacter sp. BT18]
MRIHENSHLYTLPSLTLPVHPFYSMLVSFSTKAALVFLLTGVATLPSESEQYRRQVLASSDLKPTELSRQYTARSFAPLWLHSDPDLVFGFIGDGYRRLQVKLLTIRPDAQQPGRYTVTGKAKVGTNITGFQGTFVLLHVRENKARPRAADDMPTKAVKAGIALVEYELREPEGQPTAGVFRGVLCTQWYQDRHGKLYYNDLQNYSDNYENNQFVGTWQSYKTGQVKRCNWGDYRMPNSGDFDQGAGEFSPQEKYWANGWQAFKGGGYQRDKAWWK